MNLWIDFFAFLVGPMDMVPGPEFNRRAADVRRALIGAMARPAAEAPAALLAALNVEATRARLGYAKQAIEACFAEV